MCAWKMYFSLQFYVYKVKSQAWYGSASSCNPSQLVMTF